MDVKNLLGDYPFTATDTITINHGFDRAVDFQVIVDAAERDDLVLDSYPDPTDPNNIVEIKLRSAQSGVVQLFSLGARPVNLPSSELMAELREIVPFGQYRIYVEDEAQSDTTTQAPAWDEKLKLTIPDLEAGTYRVSWYAEVMISAGNGRASQARIVLDDTTELGRTFAASQTGAIGGLWTDLSGFRQLALGAGQHTIDIDYHRVTASGTASIRRCRIEVWRMG